MNIEHILIAGHYETIFQKYLKDLQDYEFRFKSVESITYKDLDWADAYVGFNPCEQFQPAYVKWVHTFNAGINNYLAIDGWQASQTLLTRTISDFGEKMSEYCLSYILADLQQHKLFESQQGEKIWLKQSPQLLRDQTVTIFGTGETGQTIAKIFSLLGMTVYGVSNSGKSKAYFQKVLPIHKAKTLVQQADYIISTLPLTAKTEKLFNQRMFEAFDQTYFINVGRGQVVDQESLKSALNKGNIRHAVLDVFESEPLHKNSELWQRNDITITPHISALTDLDEAVTCFYHTLKNIENGEILENRVDLKRGY
ncbi:D-2-hydroxyacid dehydrogenase [Staphylococcus sp. GSSP0090]|nr:D-2-hydroxyacid dehydrogenase [Staphylococcus sp. GSSP0090]